jgi:protein-tyrosine phosphatase
MFQGITQAGIDKDTLLKALELKPELISITFKSPATQYGSMDVFFQQGLGLNKQDIAVLKEKYTK